MDIILLAGQMPLFSVQNHQVWPVNILSKMLNAKPSVTDAGVPSAVYFMRKAEG